MHGDMDDVVPLDQSKKLASLIKDCQFVVLKGLTHEYTPQQLEKLAEIMSEFFVKKLNKQ
jgi:dipeptidyl aminopeptidase/acylaminoacyl peptidase